MLTASWRVQRQECTFTLEEHDRASLVFRMRPAGAVFAGPCPIAGNVFAEALDALLAGATSASGDQALPSLFLGRVMELPGLSAALSEAARRSPGWDRASGRPRQGDSNSFVAQLLLRCEVLGDYFLGYSLEGVSVEKVLVPTLRAVRERTGADGIPDSRLPYDAQIWVRLRRR